METWRPKNLGHRRGGFTLVEVLLTTAILSIVLLAAGSTLMSALKTRIQLENELSSLEVGPVITRLIAEDLRGVVQPDSSHELFRGRKSGSSGEVSDRLDFITNRDMIDPETGRLSDFTGVSYYLIRNDSETNPGYSDWYHLIRRKEPYEEESPLEEGSKELLFSQVRSMTFEYHDGDEWKTEWSDKDGAGLPKAVRVTLELWFENPYAEGDADQYLSEQFRVIVVIPR